MTKKSASLNADQLAPARTRADWDAQGWAAESEPVTTTPRLETTISIRFDPDSALLLRRAARMKGVTKSEFVRQATVQEARKAIDENPLPASMWIQSRPELASTSASERTFVSGTKRPVTTTRVAQELIAE